MAKKSSGEVSILVRVQFRLRTHCSVSGQTKFAAEATNNSPLIPNALERRERAKIRPQACNCLPREWQSSIQKQHDFYTADVTGWTHGKGFGNWQHFSLQRPY